MMNDGPLEQGTRRANRHLGYLLGLVVLAIFLLSLYLKS